MPFYEYECPHCGYDEEVLQKITDKPLTKCPSCGKKGLRKLMSAPVFRLKGSGWYETDFKSDKENQRNLVGADKEEAKSEAKPDAKADAKADAKPDSKTDSKPEAAKSEAAKPETAKPAAEKASSSASKSAASRAKPRHKPKRTAKRPRR
jgi:putative FmdB family regulatory protein